MRSAYQRASRGLPQRAIVVGVRHGRMSRGQMEGSLAELERLVETAGGRVVERLSQDLKRIDPATHLGRGKVSELAAMASSCGADLTVIDAELSPVQNRNLEDALKVLVLDRRAVILDIFAMRARSMEGKLQVELAQLEYLAPRLVGRGRMLSQQAGRIGTRGPGETALEYERRRIRDRITLVRRRLEAVARRRELVRQRREAVPIPLVSLVGYTNAGKSSLMNALTDAGAFVEDKLFATLDPTVRRLKLPSGREVLLADTVGFIRRLPHELVESFRSTFEEVRQSHLILHVIDGSDEEAPRHARVVEGVLEEMGVAGKPRIEVVNKCDRPALHWRGDARSVRISALRGLGISDLLARLDALLREGFMGVLLNLPLDRGEILSEIYRLGHVRSVAYGATGVLVDCELPRKQFGKYRLWAAKAGSRGGSG